MKSPASISLNLIAAIAASISFSAMSAYSQNGVVTADNPIFNQRGLGAKAMSMGNAFVALSDDFSAVYWNPAGLAFMPVREFQISLGNLRNQSQSDMNGTEQSAFMQRLAFSHVGLVRSIPTRQGGFAIAVGLSSPTTFDNIYDFHGNDTYVGPGREGNYYRIIGADTVLDYLSTNNVLHNDSNLTKTYGQLNLINIAVGWQVAPGFGFGFALSPVFGSEHQQTNVLTSIATDTFQYSLEETDRQYYGMDIRTGILFTPGERIRFGLRLQAPLLLAVVEKYKHRDHYFPSLDYSVDSKGSIIGSVNGALGFAVKLPFATVSTEALFRSPSADAAQSSPRAEWKGGGAVGAEVPITAISSMVRAGYSYKQLDLYPYQQKWEDGSSALETEYTPIQNNQTLSAGYAYLIKDFAQIEAAYAYSTWQYDVGDQDWAHAVEKAYVSHQIMLSFSLRY
jgi:long-subunit fatty acid transport protein